MFNTYDFSGINYVFCDKNDQINFMNYIYKLYPKKIPIIFKTDSPKDKREVSVPSKRNFKYKNSMIFADCNTIKTFKSNYMISKNNTCVFVFFYNYNSRYMKQNIIISPNFLKNNPKNYNTYLLNDLVTHSSNYNNYLYCKNGIIESFNFYFSNNSTITNKTIKYKITQKDIVEYYIDNPDEYYEHQQNKVFF